MRLKKLLPRFSALISHNLRSLRLPRSAECVRC
jgi:hypothetical protein